jgi:hypothetical protein
MHPSIHAYVHAYIKYIRTYIHAHMHTYTHTHTYAYTHTHTYIHSHIQVIYLSYTAASLERPKPSIDQIPAELIEAGGNTLRSEIRKRINCIWNN